MNITSTPGIKLGIKMIRVLAEFGNLKGRKFQSVSPQSNCAKNQLANKNISRSSELANTIKYSELPDGRKKRNNYNL
jgi:hypothetical protein